jgi:hypothetical protein
MKSYIQAYILATALTTGFCFSAYASLPPPQQIGSITFITGGIGDEERDAMETVRKDYNLSVMSAATSGAFTGDTRIVIRDQSGEELLQADAGPLFYADLPAGRYVVEGYSDGQIKQQPVTITPDKRQHIRFNWK